MEYWDIYNEHKEKTGRIMKRNDWSMKSGEYHLTVLGIIRHPSGNFLITRRVLTKSWAPGWWEVPGGAVKAGENSRTAVIREVFEETGLDISSCIGELALTYKRVNPSEGDNYFVDCYLFNFAFNFNDVHLQKEEALEFKLATLDEIKSLAQQGVFLHYDSIKDVFINAK